MIRKYVLNHLVIVCSSVPAVAQCGCIITHLSADTFRFGTPIPCQSCGKICAFNKPKEAQDKVGSLVLIGV